MAKFHKFGLKLMGSSSIMLLLGLLLVAYVAYVVYHFYMMQINKNAVKSLKISVNEARAKRFGLIIDVRTPKERELLGFYPDSIPISINILQREVPLDISNKLTQILVYSNGDDRARIGAEMLYKAGYVNARYISQPYDVLMPGMANAMATGMAK